MMFFKYGAKNKNHIIPNILSRKNIIFSKLSIFELKLKKKRIPNPIAMSWRRYFFIQVIFRLSLLRSIPILKKNVSMSESTAFTIFCAEISLNSLWRSVKKQRLISMIILVEVGNLCIV